MTPRDGDGRRSWAWALGLSALAHLLIAAWLLQLKFPDAPGLPEISLELNLVPDKRPAEPAVSPAEPAPPRRPARVADSAQTTETPQARVKSPTSQPEAPNEALAESRAPAPRLNLQRPSNWESLAIESPEQQKGGWFKRSDNEALAERRRQRAVAQALTRTQRERLGMSAEAYRQQTDDGERVKTAKGCFVKRLENGLSGRQERWWRTACVDSRKSEWRREVLTFAPDHRVEVDD